MNLTEATIKALYDGLTDDENVSGVDGLIDDILVITDPEISTDEYVEIIERAQEIVDDTPEGNIPFMDDYIGEYLQTCPICGTTFAEDHMLEPGAACPVCLEQPESFVMVGKIEAEDMVAIDNGMDEDDDISALENEFNVEQLDGVEETPSAVVDGEPEEENVEDNRLKDVASKQISGNKLTETVKLEETGEWDENDDELVEWKNQFIELLHTYFDGVTTWDEDDVRGFDKYQGPTINIKNYEIWSNTEDDTLSTLVAIGGDGYAVIASKEDAQNLVGGKLEMQPLRESDENSNAKSLKQQLIDVLPAEEIDTHESDLYVKVSDKSTEILKPFMKEYPYLVSKFRDDIGGNMWYEIIMGNAEDNYKERYGKVEESINSKLTEASSTYTYGDLVSVAEDEWGDDVIIDGTDVEGIYDVQTARHGGYLVDINLYPELAEFGAKTRHENINAFEEDYEALKVLWLFPQLLRDKEAKWLTAELVDKYDDEKKFINKFPERKLEEAIDVEDEIVVEDSESKYELIDADGAMISDLENNSALTWEGSIINPEVLEELVTRLETETDITVPVKFYTWTGELMNDKYGLTDKNAYPNDLNFLAIPTDSWTNLGKATTFKTKSNARWLDDIVDSNAERQRQINGEESEENWNTVYEESYDRQALENKIIG